MRVVTYANAAYWPVAKLFVESAKRFPDVASALTVMVTDRATLKDCVETGVMCFLDTDMVDILGERMNDDGSIHAGQSDVNGDLGKALRVAWTWRKVHVVYTLVQAGYGALFLDASTLLLRDPRAFVKSKLDAGALLVTLSDFGWRPISPERWVTDSGQVLERLMGAFSLLIAPKGGNPNPKNIFAY